MINFVRYLELRLKMSRCLPDYKKLVDKAMAVIYTMLKSHKTRSLSYNST